MSHPYRYYRSVILSDVPLPAQRGLADASALRFVVGDIAIAEPETPVFVLRTGRDDVFLSVSRVGSAFLMRFPPDVAFLIDPQSKTITASPGLPAGTLAHYLLDQVLPRYLTYTGACALHASSVNIDGRAALFLGDSGIGKSTLASELHFRHHPAIADDVTFIEQTHDGFQAVQSYPGFRLWPDSADRHHHPSYVQVPVAEDYAKRRLLHPGAVPDVVSAPLGCIFVMRPPDPKLDKALIEPLPASDGFTALLTQYFSFIPTDPEVVQREFATFTALAGKVPFFTLAYPRAFAALDAVTQAICAHVEGMRG